MAAAEKGNPLFGAAVLKLTLATKLGADAAMRDFYEATLRDLGVTSAEVEAFIAGHGPELEAAMAKQRGKDDPQ